MKSLLPVIGLAMILPGIGPAFAQDTMLPDTGAGGANPMAHNGSGVFHGNYCGVGDRGPGLAPTDALDAACMHHDACTPEGGLPSCACNARFQQEVRAVAADPGQPDEERALAGTVDTAIPMIPCR